MKTFSEIRKYKHVPFLFSMPNIYQSQNFTTNMSNLKDNIVYHQTLAKDEPTTFPFTGKSVSVNNDRNNANYTNGQIEFVVDSLNSNRWNSWAEAEIHMPIQVTTTGKITNNVANAYCMSLKNGGAAGLLHSLSLFLDDQEVVRHSGGLNVVNVYNMHTSLSATDYETIGPTIGYYPDSVEGQIWDAETGLMNNDPSTNIGHYKRAQWASEPKTGTLLAEFCTELSTNLKSHCVLATDSVVHNLMCVLKLDRAHPVFKQLGMIRGGKTRLVLQTHLAQPCKFEATATVAANSLAQFTACKSTTQYGQFPFLLSRGGAGTASVKSGIVLADGAVSISAIVGAGVDRICQLRIPTYVADPSVDQALSSGEADRHVVRYEDYTLMRVSMAPGQSLTQQSLTSSLPNMRRLLIVPFLAAGSNGSEQLTMGPCASALSCCPAMTAPYAFLTQLQVWQSGTPIYESSKSSITQIYSEEIEGSNAFNANVIDALRSGCINADTWQKGYGYYDINLSRHDKAEDDIPKSLTFSCVNSGTKTLDLFCFVFQEQQFTISRATGKVTQR